MQNEQLLASANLGGDPKPVKVDNNVRQAWNDYVQWLDKKGLKGNPALDHNDLGGKMIDQYRREHPDTPLTRQLVVPIQQDFSNYRNYMLNQIRQGKGQFGQGVNESNFMKGLSTVDGVPGQLTTSYSFPRSYMNTFENGKLINTQDQGFSTASNLQ